MRTIIVTSLIVAFGGFLPDVTPAQDPPEHRIGIRKTTDFAEFYNTETDQVFVPRGTNYVELRYDPSNSYLISGLFLPEYHDEADVEFDFERMSALGYNTARIFVDLCREELCIGDPGGGLRDDVMDNVASLLEQAKRHGIFILFTANWLPDFGGYLDAHQLCAPTFDAGNCLLLSRAGVEAYKRFFGDFVEGLIERDAPTDWILGYQLRNEVFLEDNQPPLSWSSGQVEAANGETYNMASEDDKVLMVDDGLIFWANEVAEVIKDLDPTALVTTGFFPPNSPHEWRPGDYRVVQTERVLKESELDFLDFHGYPGEGLTMEEHAENYGMVGFDDKPIVFGEFGPFLHSYATPAAAAAEMRRWQSEACNAGFDGFLYWLWDPDKAPRVNDSVWGVHDGTGEIARAIAPVYNLDPCAGEAVPNLALGKPAVASRSLADRPPEGAFDGNIDTGWGSGADAPQWIEVDLGTPVTIGRMTLAVDQFPGGQTVHQITGQTTPTGPITLLAELSGVTNSPEELEVEPDEPWSGYRFIRVTTTESPSWVSWFEIRIYPPDTTLVLPLPPDLVSPPPFSEQLSTMPSIGWNPVALADSYRVEISDRDHSVVFERGGLTETSLAVDLADDERYSFRVRAENADGPGPWSGERVFEVGNPVFVGTSNDGVPHQSRLISAYPNPFSHEASFDLDLSREVHVELDVFDVRGRSVGRAVSGRIPAGSTTVRWRPESLSTGVYLYRLVVGDEVHFGKLLHLAKTE